MKSDYDYQLPWRPNFEARAIFGWIIGAALAWIAASRSGLPFSPFLWLMIFCLVMVVFRLPSAVGVWYRKHRLRRFKFEYLDVDKLVRTVRKHPDWLWFGWGFDWGQRHAQLAYEILKRDVSELIPPDHQRMGATWVHGLETHEEEVFQPISHTAGHTLKPKQPNPIG